MKSCSPFRSANNLFPLIEKDRKGNSGMRELRLTLIKAGSGTGECPCASCSHVPVNQTSQGVWPQEPLLVRNEVSSGQTRTLSSLLVPQKALQHP